MIICHDKSAALLLALSMLPTLFPPTYAQLLKHMRQHGHDHRHDSRSSEQGSLKTKQKKTLILKNLYTPRDADAESREMPLFVKFHKTGSGTAANIFRRHCPDAMRMFPDNRLPWRGGPRCGPLPHEHATIHLYRSLGQKGAEWCLFNRTRVSLFTVLRDPLDKFFSGAFFWKRELQKHGLDHIQAKLETAPESLSVKDVNDLAKGVHWYGKEMGGKVFSARAGPLLQFANIIGRTNVNDREQRDFPTPAIVDRACRNIRRDFTIGYAEAMDSFTTLVSLKTGWPLESLCTQDFHFNKNRPDSMRGASLRSALKPQTLARLQEMLAPDRAVYNCAVAQHHNLTESYGSKFEDAYARFTSESFQATCDAEFKKQKKLAPNKKERQRWAAKISKSREGRAGDGAVPGEETGESAVGETRCIIARDYGHHQDDVNKSPLK